jgi:hypothetical protein
MIQPIPPYRVVFRRSARTALAMMALAALPALSAEAAPARPPALLSAAGEARLELPSGQQVTARLPEGASLDTTTPLGGAGSGWGSGWLAAGTQPAAGGSAGRDLLLLAGDGQTVSTLPSPPGKTGSLRREPLPLVEGGQLAGLVWLEGENRRSFGVRFAAWNGTVWEEPEVVAPPGPGSQLALTAARLDDGSWLLAWSAFDGQDDEIVWSRRVNGAWTRPRRVADDNRVPDITPTLTAVDGGALLAWSRYDVASGQYRVVVARFANGRWTAPAVTGPAGSLDPTFEAASAAPSGTVKLLYRTAAPRGWAALEMDAAGEKRSAAVWTPGERKP